MSITVQTMEYVYSPPLSGRIAAPRGFFAGVPTTAASSSQALPDQHATIGTVTRTPLDSSILEQQMRMFMVERRAGTAYASSSSASLPLPPDMPAPPTPSSSQNTGKPLPPVGLRRGVPMVHKGSNPPGARLGRRGASPPNKAALQKGQSLPVSREQSPTPLPRVEPEVGKSLSLENVSQGRPRSNTDIPSHPPYAQVSYRSHSPAPEPVDYRPQVPGKDIVRSVVAADHTRSRSLSPSSNGKEKSERRRNVFGLFPSEKKDKDKEREESSKRGVADHIAAVFHRKVSNQSVPQQGDSPATSYKSAPTPQTGAVYGTPPFGLSPPQPWIQSATTPPINNFGWLHRNNSSNTSTSSANSQPRKTSRTQQHSRDNSSSTNASTASSFRGPSSGLAKQASFDVEEAIEKVWGPLEGIHHSRPVQRGVSPSGTPGQKQRRTPSRTPQNPFTNEYPNPSPLLPPVNKEAYQKRTLPPAPGPAPVPSPLEIKPAPVEQKIAVEEKPESPISPLLPVAYNPYEPESPVIEPLLPIAMLPPTPKRLSSRVSCRLSVSIPPVGRPITQRYSAPGTPAEYFKATTSASGSASHEHRYVLELPTGLGEFHLDSEIEVQEQDEDDILVWLDSLKFEYEQGRMLEENGSEGEGREKDTPHDGKLHPMVVIDAASPAVETPPPASSIPAEVGISVARPRSPSSIPRKPVGSAKATATTTAAPPTPPSAPNTNLLSPPPVPQQLSPPSPSDYSGAFSGRISYASSTGDVFKYDNSPRPHPHHPTRPHPHPHYSYTSELPPFDWRSSSELSDCGAGAGGLRLQNLPPQNQTSSISSSPQTQPSTTFSSPNLSEYSVSSTGTPSSGGLCSTDIDAILGQGKSNLATTHVYIPDSDDSSDEGLRSAEIEEILRAQMAREKEEIEKRKVRSESEKKNEREMEMERLRELEEEMDREYWERMESGGRRRTRYVRGRNSGLEGDILFVLRGEDII